MKTILMALSTLVVFAFAHGVGSIFFIEGLTALILVLVIAAIVIILDRDED